ncbi:MAG: Hsp20/alpha crystallin family protein, partial [Anaerolineales bacterium]|nr:Hsp20/alpha crystallin family protein [Anaerolineales bacterium]
FCRTMTLPAEIKADAVKAEFENGILTLTLPKAEAAKRTSIKIKAK